MVTKNPVSGGEGDDAARVMCASPPGRSTVDLKTGELNWQPEEVSIVV